MTDQTITLFSPPGVERLRIEPDGKFYVEGRYVTTDKDVFDGFYRWVAGLRCPKCSEKEEVG